ncbi:MAG: hypothetical protein AAFP91_13435, partial [Pseudomonadota bacterium]
MKTSARYAIYYAPPADDPLWALGSEWLGRDAYTGENLTRPDYPDFLDNRPVPRLIADADEV